MASFKINGFDVEVLGKIEQERAEYPLCDEQGNEVITERISGSVAHKNKEGVILNKTYRLINGKPFDKFKKTSKINIYAETPKIEVYNMIIERIKLVRNEELRKYLQKEDRALGQFLYSEGNGFKAYEGYIVPFQDKLLLFLGFGNITKQIAELEDKKGKVEEKEISVAVANPEEVLLQQIQVKS